MSSYDKSAVYEWVIYRITSPIGRVYIGKSSNFKDRMRLYSYGKYKNQPIINRSINKYGFANHKIEIIDTLLGTVGESNSKEMFWIRSHMSNYSRYKEFNGMNLTDGGDGAKGVVYSTEARKRMSEGQKRSPHKGKSFLGKNHTEETKRKISEAKTGKRPNRVYRPFTEEEKRNLSIKLKGVNNNPYTGKKRPPEQIEKWKVRKLSKPICQYDLNGNLINEYPSIREAKRVTGIDRDTIRDSINQSRSFQKIQFVFKLKNQ